MRELFKLAPAATLKTAFITYHGAADFEANYRATRYGKENAGMQPLSTPYAELCTCEATESDWEV